MDFSFYPALTSLPVPKYQYKGKYISWVGKNPILFYDKMLISYYYGKKGSKDDIGDHITSVIGDSGGFQATSLGIDIDPKDVIDWQNRVCDIGLTLDIPPFDQNNVIGGNYLTGSDFDKCMNISNKNANIMRGRKDENLNLYLVLQGDNDQDRQRWLDEGRMEYDDWEGYALSVKPPSDPYILVDWLKFAIDNDLKNIHVLGVSGKYTMGILLYLSNYFDSIKFDSSSYNTGRRFHKYNFPYNISNGMILTSKENIQQEKYKIIPDILPCDCPICRGIDDMKIFFDDSMRSDVAELISMHNLYQYIRYIQVLKSILPNPYLYRQFIPKISKIIEYSEVKINGTSSLSDWV